MGAPLETRTRRPVVLTHERGGINDQPRHRTPWERERYASFDVGIIRRIKRGDFSRRIEVVLVGLMIFALTVWAVSR